MRFSLLSVKCPTTPPSFRLLPSTVSLSELCSTIWLLRVGCGRKFAGAARHSIESSENAFVVWSFNLEFACYWKSSKPYVAVFRRQNTLAVDETFQPDLSYSKAICVQRMALIALLLCCCNFFFCFPHQYAVFTFLSRTQRGNCCSASDSTQIEVKNEVCGKWETTKKKGFSQFPN